jgi:hypothetical protein
MSWCCSEVFEPAAYLSIDHGVSDTTGGPTMGTRCGRARPAERSLLAGRRAFGRFAALLASSLTGDMETRWDAQPDGCIGWLPSVVSIAQ